MKTNPKQTPYWVRWVYLALAVFQLFLIILLFCQKADGINRNRIFF